MDYYYYQVIGLIFIKLINSHYLIFCSIMHQDFHKILMIQILNLMVL
jgi:hypothetical protein